MGTRSAALLLALFALLVPAGVASAAGSILTPNPPVPLPTRSTPKKAPSTTTTTPTTTTTTTPSTTTAPPATTSTATTTSTTTTRSSQANSLPRTGFDIGQVLLLAALLAGAGGAVRLAIVVRRHG
jgi:uncharacterized surface anchored protein